MVGSTETGDSKNCRAATDRARRPVSKRQDQPAGGDFWRAAGARPRQGSVREGTSIGDPSPEARAHAMSVEPNVASIDYMGDRLHLLRLPGFGRVHPRHAAGAAGLRRRGGGLRGRRAQDAGAASHPARTRGDSRLPRLLFLNKIDLAGAGVRETLAMLQPASRTPLLLRQLPVWQHGVATGFVDLALERAFLYREHAPSTVIEMPTGVAPDQKEARYSMLERLADYDDALMEQLIGEIEPPRDRVFDDLAKELRGGHVVPLLMGSADRGHGVTRLLKALRHEAPGVAQTRERLGIPAQGPALAQVVRTIHTGHGGKLSLARVLRGAFADGATVVSSRGAEERIAGLSRLMGAASAKIARAEQGETLAFARLEHVLTGDRFSRRQEGARAGDCRSAAGPDPVHRVHVKDRKDEVRLAAALAKLCEEDPALVYFHDQELGELKLMGQGEMHLRVTIERLATASASRSNSKKPSVAYRETIRDAVSARGRHKKQSGGHGQFGDVAVDVAPRARGEGFVFAEKVHGGTVPRQYFSSVEAGARDALTRGPLGFPVVDVAVTLTDGSYHSVDSLRHGVSRGGQNRAGRSPAQGASRPAGAGSRRLDLRARRRDGARERAGQRETRPDPRLRGARGLGRMGHVERADPGGGDRRSHRRIAVGDRRAQAP